MKLADEIKLGDPENGKAESRVLAANTSVPSIAPIAADNTHLLGPEGIVATVAAIIGGIFFMRRKFFQDNADISKGKSETTLLANLAEQAETYKKDAKEAWARRTQDAETIARQTVQIENLRITLSLVIAVLREVAPERAAMFDKLPDIYKLKDDPHGK